jgi:hypothetical protein
LAFDVASRNVPEGGIPLRTRPFLLMNLLYELLAGTFQGLDLEDSLRLELEIQGEGVRIRLFPVQAKGSKADIPAAKVPDGAADLCTALSAQLTAQGTGYELVLQPCAD